MSNSIVVSDRSRIETWERCPRARYYGYHFEGMGIEKTAIKWDAMVGIACHNSLHDVFAMARAGNFTDAGLDLALDNHIGNFSRLARERGVELEAASGYEQDEEGNIIAQEGQLDFLLAVYESWVRQSVTAWTAIRLPHFIQNYEIVAMEQEEELLMAGGQLLFLSRPDAVLKRYADGELFILNFKTVGEPNQWWQEQWALDQQTLSEVLPIEARMGQRVSGVLIEGLVKGKKNIQYPPKSGNWWLNSPLMWMWKKEGAPPFPPEYAARYEWTDEMGSSHRLGKGWGKQPAWEDEMGLRGWLQWLHENEPELLRQQFVDLPPILRSEHACASWQRTVEFREIVIDEGAKAVASDLGGHSGALDEFFPQHTSGGNCIRFRSSNSMFAGRCEFYDICHGSAGFDPLSNGYQKRVPNHPREAEYRTHVAFTESEILGINEGSNE